MGNLLQINVTANSGSHGKIAEEIGQLAMRKGWRSVIAYGRSANPSQSELIRIGGDFDIYEHAIESYLFDNHGLASRCATKRFIQQIKEINPDIIHLHNIHGYYINYRLLFEYLNTTNIPVVWTLHDCWCFTGHCTHFEYDNCFKWTSGCSKCEHKKVYPQSLFLEKSDRNYSKKKKSFTSLTNLTLVPVSEWLGKYLRSSFMKEQKIRVIHNGIDLNIFRPFNRKKDKDLIEVLGVANNWRMRKGLPDFIELRKLLPEQFRITLIGLSNKEISRLPAGIRGINRTTSVEELVSFYNKADILVNPTYEDNYPTVNLEAMACGTPVLTYETGGSPEAISPETGWVVKQGDISAVAKIVKDLPEDNYIMRKNCRRRAEEQFDKDLCFEKYLSLYEELLR